MDLDSLDGTESIVASDGCSGLTLDTMEVILAGDCPNSYTRQRTFVATDACGLSIEHIQTVTVSDNEAPTLYVPDDYTIGCQEEPTYDDAWAEDNCSSEVEIEVTESIIPGSCPAEYVIQRTFTARTNVATKPWPPNPFLFRICPHRLWSFPMTRSFRAEACSSRLR